jgi:hypothetical protein
VKNSENHSGTSLGTNTPGAEGRPSYGPCGRCDLPYKAHAVAHPPMSLARRMALTQCFYITPPRDERPEAQGYPVIVVTQTLGDIWATPEQFAEMSDGEILSLIREDIYSFLEDATWEIKR